MAHGSRTPDDVRMRFATEFARTGNISESARLAKLPRETARDIARELEADPVFAEARRSLLKHGLERAEVMASELLELAATRAKRKPRELPVGEGGIMIHDKSPDYIRAFTDLYRATQQHAKQKLDADPNRQSPGPLEVVIRRAGSDKPSE